MPSLWRCISAHCLVPNLWEKNIRIVHSSPASLGLCHHFFLNFQLILRWSECFLYIELLILWKELFQEFTTCDIFFVFFSCISVLTCLYNHEVIDLSGFVIHDWVTAVLSTMPWWIKQAIPWDWELNFKHIIDNTIWVFVSSNNSSTAGQSQTLTCL